LLVVASLLAPASVALADDPSSSIAPPALTDQPGAGATKGRTGEGADPPKTNDADLATKLPNFIGLSGFRDVIDARTPKDFTLRGGLFLQQSKQDLHGNLIDMHANQYDLQAYMGIALLGMIEFGAGLPFSVQHTTNGLRFDGSDRESGRGVGNLQLGGKLTIQITPELALAPYVVGQLPSANSSLDQKSGIDFGGAVTATAYESRVAFHANVAGSWHEGGDVSIKFRFGPSFVPIASKVILLRPFVYLDGTEEMNSNKGLDLRVAFGVQSLVLDLFTLSLGADYRLVAQSVPEGITHDDGTWRIDVGVGVAF
jgi:hypothetical protein